ncbi:MAG: DUF3800 domain-containing protein [Patescibacteria group bacterium]
MLGKLFERSKSRAALPLGDCKSIWTKFCFLDESGSLNNPTEVFFTVGYLKCVQPYYLQSKILYQRSRANFHDELKFNKLSHYNFDFCKFALDSVLETKGMFFSSYSLDKRGEYFTKEFGLNPWQAYEDISIRVIESSIGPNEILTVIADHVTVPRDVRFEVNVKRKINEDAGRLAIAGVARFDSRSNDLLQISDLLIGAITYDLKLATGLIKRGDKYKRRFLEYFKSKLEIPNFAYGYKKNLLDCGFNIFVDKDIQKRLPRGQVNAGGK